MKAQGMQVEQTLKLQGAQEQAQFDSQEREATSAHEEQKRAGELDFIKQKQAMKPTNGASK
jgi:hypothetical protein